MLPVSPADNNIMGWSRGILRTPPPHPTDDSRTYRILFPQEVQYITCLVGGFLGRVTSLIALWVHFIHCHMCNTLVIM